MKLKAASLNFGNLWDAFFTKIVPFNPLCSWLGKNFIYFAPQSIELSIANYVDLQNTDERGAFIPVKQKAIVERLAERGGSQEKNERRALGKIAEALYRYETMDLYNELRDSYAPFDLDSDSIVDRTYTKEEKEREYRRFVKSMEEVLRRCNFEEIPRQAIDEILEFHIPGELPVVAKYDDFLDFRIFVRGYTRNPARTILPSSAWGKTVSVAADTMSRVCVFTRLDPSSKAFRELTKTIRPKKDREGKEVEIDELVSVRLFKDISLENLKMVTPKPTIKWRTGDFVMTGVPFTFSSGTAVAKFVGAAFIKLNIIGLITFFVGFLGLAVRNTLKLFHKRTSYMQRYVSELYGKSLASNLIAANRLATLAEEQDFKEFIIGYFMALELGGWATEKEIDEAAEAFLKEEFGVDVDFEAPDALRKLLENEVLEVREDNDAGETVKRYRAIPLEQALETIDRRWDNFFQYNV